MAERHSLLDGDATSDQERDNVFDDQFEVEDDFEFDGVADGFRPNVEREEGVHRDTEEIRQESDGDDDTLEPVIHSVSAHYASNPTLPSRSRNSIRKSRTYANPFANPDDAEPESEPRMEFEPDQDRMRRSVSSASSRMFAGTGSPRFGAGPSHPYGMYQQGTVARTASVATTSTARPSLRQSLSQQAPQHPYAMYPQGVGDDDLDGEEGTMQHNPVPVGFPGIGQGYTRRRGPDGEEQDIIGEDGHTEQLPPYTRYPEEGPEKMPLLPSALHSRPPVHGTDPGMPLMHTSILPVQTPAPPQSMSDESTLVERRGSGSHLALLSSHGSDSGSSFSEKTNKSWRQKSWKERRKTKLCGFVPMWWIWLAMGVVIFVGAVLGGVIGGFWAGSKHASSDNISVLTTTSPLWDASAVSAPPPASIPTGTFALGLGAPEEVQNDCLPQSDQKDAWDCNFFPNSDLAIVVSEMPGGSLGANVQYASDNMSIAYGSQLSMMNTSLASFLYVLDKDEPNNGFALYFQQYYDKVVVVPNHAIQTRKRNGRRQGYFHPDFHVPDAWQARKQMAVPGEQPWFCVWNQTFLEGFIYVNQPMSTSSSSAPTPTSTNSTTATLQSTAATTAAATVATASATSPVIVTHVVTYPTTTVTYVGTFAPDQEPSLEPAWTSQWAEREHDWRRNRAENDEERVKRQPPSLNPSVGSSAVPTADPYDSLPKFPYVLKLEERRVQMPNAIQPYCQLYQILNDGSANLAPDPNNNGNPIIVQLNENDMSFGAYTSAEASQDDNQRRKRGTVPGACHCQWMSGE